MVALPRIGWPLGECGRRGIPSLFPLAAEGAEPSHGLRMQVLHDRCKGVGIEEFVCKPFRVEDLQQVVKHTRRLPRLVPAVPLSSAAAAEQPDTTPAPN